MKKVFIILISLFVGFIGFAQQVSRDMVIVEIATGFWCGYCPGAAMGADDLVDNGHNVAIFENHNGDSLANTYSNARNSYYGISSYPTAKFDGILTVVGGSSSTSMYPNYLPKVNQRNGVLSDFTIDLSFTNLGDNFQATVVVENVGGNTSNNLVLQLGITESQLPITWGGMNHINFVTRRLVPNQSGTQLNFSGGTTQTVILDFTLEGYWDSEYCELIAFVQNNSGKEILQGTKMSLYVPPPLDADFYADNLTPGIGETVNFTDLSSNNPIEWAWSFSPSTVTYIGGTTSASQNPQVQFDTDGYYTVELIATIAEGSDIEIKTDYISVIGPTVADFSADFLDPGVGQTVNFTDLSTYGPTIWSWTFPPSTVTYVEGTSSASQNPKVQFNGVGYYTVELTATNVYGSDTEIKTNYINVPSFCDASGNGNFLFIGAVQIESINNFSGQDYYYDYSYLSTDLAQGQTGVEITVVNGYPTPFGDEDLGIWIDWNQNGTFSDVGENVVCEVDDEGQGTFFFDVPENAVSGTTTMRLRIKYTDSDCGDPCGTTTYGEVEDYSINIIAPDVSVDVTVLLEGPFNGTNMNPALNSVLPLSHPFNIGTWNYNGTESVTSIPGADIVDWVLVDIRDAVSVDQATPATRIGRQAAFLRNDGRVVGLEGSPVLNFATSLSNDLYIVIYQRNHIPVISGTSPIPSEDVYNYDFSTDEGQAYGGSQGHKEIGSGIWGMVAGDGDASGLIDIDDKINIWEGEAATKGYKSGDFNMDLDVDNKDKNNNWLPNKDKGTWVPE